MKHLMLIVLSLVVIAACGTPTEQLSQQGIVGDLDQVIGRYRSSLMLMQQGERSQQLELTANVFLVEFAALDMSEYPKSQLLMLQLRKDCIGSYLKGSRLIDCLERSDGLIGILISEEID